MREKTIQQLFNFKDKTAIITGAAMGIGFGIAKRFIEAGANVILSDIDEKTGQKRAKELGHACRFFKTDVSLEKEVVDLVDFTLKEYGKIDVLVNNAGIFPAKPALEMEEELWDKIQAVNLKGVFLCSKIAGKAMVKQGGGVIINIASIDALHPSQVGLAAYDASKHGVWGFTKNFALEVAGKNIRVNAIAPGGILTEGVEKMTGGAVRAGDTQGEMIKQFTAKIPMQRFGTPDEIATVALFLASDAAKYMTGSMIVVDGGYLLA
ncbi:SDR family oxidoreductase [Candidatus Parcubacteria bacterium]|nr:SDR family oxidoreductase [Candidatus Parcubacteria bacterium]